MSAGDTIRFHKRSALAGAVLGVLLGGTGVSLLVGMAPDSGIVRAMARSFAGSACRPVEDELATCRARTLCLRAVCETKKCEDD